MRISDWSSDVYSSDLYGPATSPRRSERGLFVRDPPTKADAGRHVPCRRDRRRRRPDHGAEPDGRTETEGSAKAPRAAARMRAVDRARKDGGRNETGKASCRERVGTFG